jgi:hypothetical protein
MARVDVPLTEITRAGVAPGAEVTGDAVNNHSFTNDGKVFLLARNSAATATRTVTLRIAQTVDSQTVTSRTVAVPISVSRYVGPFPTDVWGQTVLIDVDHADLKLSTYHLP